MLRTAFLIAALAASQTLVACSAPRTSSKAAPVQVSSGCLAQSSPVLRQEMIAQVNAQRTAAGLAPLRENAQLSAAAQRHACDQAERGFFSHTGSDGSDVVARVSSAGYSTCLTAENTAWGQRDPATVMAGWMGSPGHRANILRPRVEEIGIGFAPRVEGQRGPQWVQVFARPC